ncbi:MAG: HAD family hydrolase, partial [Ktedonobacterales bacterium]
MTTYRLVALDLDGTALTSEGQISQRLLRAVRAARVRGAVVTLATARRWVGAAPLAEALGIEAAIILYDGATARAFPGGEVELAHALGPRVAQRAAEALAARGLQVVAQVGGVGGERLIACEGAAHPQWMGSYLASFPQQVTYAPLADLASAAPETLRLVSFGPEAWLRSALEALADVSAGRQILSEGSYGISELTVFSPEASKGSGVRWLAARLGIPMAQTLAIGDGVNDISMLRAAGLGVAMGGAEPEVRA